VNANPLDLAKTGGGEAMGSKWKPISQPTTKPVLPRLILAASPQR
jgi:hypothetical protein